MPDHVTVVGRDDSGGFGLSAALQAGGLVTLGQDVPLPSIGPSGALPGADILITLMPDAQHAIEAARDFAAADESRRSRLIVLARPVARKEDWPACRETAVLTAFTRHSALALAAQDIRVNGVELGLGVPDQDVADAILAMWRWRSMTGQTIRLDVP